MEEIFELHALFKGRVQGVGFRWTLVDHAKHFHLVGFAKNLANGTVEVVAIGSKENLNAFLEAVKMDPGFAKIESIKTDFQKPKGAFTEFRIDH